MVKNNNIFNLFNNGIKNLNNSKFFAGLVMLMLNIGSKYITIEFSNSQKAFFKNSVFRQILIFSIAWLGTRDIYTAIMLTASFVVLSDYLFNENSKLCVIPQTLISKIDTNNDGKLSDDEINKAITALKRAKK